MKSKIIIEEDTITEYAETLASYFKDSQEILLENISEELTESYIEPYVPQWNPNLYESGEDPDNWFKKISEEKSVVEILYTGFTEFSQHMDVWWEMGGYSTTRQTSLKRDYAYYQEIGTDLYHGSMPKAPKFAGHHYVQKGTEKYSGIMHRDVGKYLAQVMELKNPRMGQQTF